MGTVFLGLPVFLSLPKKKNASRTAHRALPRDEPPWNVPVRVPPDCAVPPFLSLLGIVKED